MTKRAGGLYKAETARELAHRLYTVCGRKKRAAEALSYNALVQSWPEIVRLVREAPIPGVQAELFQWAADVSFLRYRIVAEVSSTEGHLVPFLAHADPPGSGREAPPRRDATKT
jgi:hypothetical protein